VVLASTETPLALQNVPTPSPKSGQVLLKILAVPILSYTRLVITGKMQYPLALPFTPGVAPIARVESVGSDATSLQAGQLVYVDITVRARDDQLGAKGTSILQGLFAGLTPEARCLADNDWRHGSWAEKQIVPLENVHVLDEEVLLHRRGYTLTRLAWINTLLVPYGGWEAADLQPGETAIVCFATGHFGGVAIDIALAMGAGRVVAVGRRLEALEAIQAKYGEDKISIVALKGNTAEDSLALRAATPRNAGADCYLDLSPPSAAETASTHIQSAIAALKAGGRAVLMGGITSNVSLSYAELVMRNITVKGNFMSGRDAPTKLIRMIEAGNLPLNRLNVEEFRFEEFEDAIDAAAAAKASDKLVVLEIQK
jgi:NADPH:quinone reductase-like Zn-dependent oxidoreductase